MPVDKPAMQFAAALEREHQQVDAGLEAFLTYLDHGRVDTDLLNEALDGLRRHIYLEERILFPPIRQNGMSMPVAVMMTEHGEIWRTMDGLAGRAAAGDIAGMTALCRLLLDQLANHNAKEEQVIYPVADSGLESEDAAELAEFLETGLIPDCWQCREAR